VAILEKTNQQLSLWWNPYGVFVSSLGVLFTIGAVVAAYFLFRQSREYRLTIDAAIADYRRVLDAMVAERLADTKRHVEQSLVDARNELTTGADETEKRQVLEKRIAALEEQLKAIHNAESHGYFGLRSGRNYFSSGEEAVPVPNLGFGGVSLPSVTCSRCATTFPRPGLPALSDEVKCPTCGEVKNLS
jgi:rubrerythrin